MPPANMSTHLMIAGFLLGAFAKFAFGLEVDENFMTEDHDIEAEGLSEQQLRGLHKHMDQDQDGKMSMSEVMKHAEMAMHTIAQKDVVSILEELDTNRDGNLDLSEHLTDVEKQASGADEEELKEQPALKTFETEKFKAADTNGDGVLSRIELAALFFPEINQKVLGITVARSIKQRDRDGDDMLSPNEFWEVLDEDGGDLSDEEKADFVKLDVNRDGRLDASELQRWESGQFHTEAAMQHMFNVADKDDDVHLTLDEMLGAREQISASDAQYHLTEWADHLEL